jgi:hypothetical protein
MEESSTYQYIISKGALKGAKELLMLQDQIRFGPPDAKTTAAIEAITRP